MVQSSIKPQALAPLTLSLDPRSANAGRLPAVGAARGLDADGQQGGRKREVVSLRFKSPKRVTITIPQALYERLVTMSDAQGRSFSNLASFLLESSLMQTP